MIPSDEALIQPITHVALAFMRSGLFLDSNRTEWPSDRSVESARQAFAPRTKILVAIGGWGDTDFSIAARDDTSRKSFAHNVARMVEATGADGALRFTFTKAMMKADWHLSRCRHRLGVPRRQWRGL